MDAELLNDILSCPNLPSLPAVAVRVLELTSDPDVRLDELARTIQGDQALSVKILRTVNSSFYGLRKRCTSIDKALVLLGLAPVKSLVLGFSLVSCMSGDADDGFPYQQYWRRSLESAVAAKTTAKRMGFECDDEAFLAGLFQDMGMVAIFRALDKRYLDILARAGGSHADLVRTEMEALEINHPEVGAILGESWKLPPELYIPVKYHERPTACPTEHSRTARCVAVGNIVHEVLRSDDPTPALRECYRRAEQWLGLSNADVDGIITEAGDAARELGSLFEIDVSGMRNPADVIAEADRRLIDMTRASEVESFAARELASVIVGDGRDPLTGLPDRAGFSEAVRGAFPEAAKGAIELSVVQFVIDGIEGVRANHGEACEDELVLGTTVMLQRQFEPLGGIVARLQPACFGVVLPQTARRTAVDASQWVCDRFASSATGWLREIAGIGAMVRLSAGVSTIDAESLMVFKTPDLLVEAANRSVQSARNAGGGCVRAFVPRPKAA